MMNIKREGLDLKNIIEIARQFQIEGDIIDIHEYGNGNINKTFIITTDRRKSKNFIFQRINTDVFLEPELLMQNMCIVSEHIYNRVLSSNIHLMQNWKVPRIIQTQDNQNYWIAPDETFWRVIDFIENAESFDTIDNSKIAMEIGSALGIFHDLVSDLAAEKLTDTLEGFHITPHYINHYDQVIKEKKADDCYEIDYCMKFVNKRRLWANVLEDAKAKGKLSVHVIHGDPKVNNFLIDKNTQKVVSMIDLDTVKPGLIHYDIGDCLRSGCNPLGEEAGAEWESVYFDTDICRSVLRGYISQAKNFLTENDYEYLYDAIRLIAFELGLRFFTDYLEGNVYFQDPEYPEQNLYRALVQFKLTESIEFYETRINKMIMDIK